MIEPNHLSTKAGDFYDELGKPKWNGPLDPPIATLPHFQPAPIAITYPPKTVRMTATEAGITITIEGDDPAVVADKMRRAIERIVSR